MQSLLAIAAVIAFFTGLAHSVLGERLIFRHLRDGSLVPTRGAPPLQARNVRILWATWHLATLFGWAFAAVLLALAWAPETSPRVLVIWATVAAYAGSSLLVLMATRGRHPGWIALAVVAALVWVAGGAVT